MLRSLILTLAVLLAAPTLAQTRHALVVGVDRYAQIVDLRTARNDARAVVAALQGAGFLAMVLLDPDPQLRIEVQRLAAAVHDETIGDFVLADGRRTAP